MWRVHHDLAKVARKTRAFGIQLGSVINHYGRSRVFLQRGKNDMGNMVGRLREASHEDHQQRLLSHDDAKIKGHMIHWVINDDSEGLEIPDAEEMLNYKEKKRKKKEKLEESIKVHVKGLVLGLRLMKRLTGQPERWIEVRYFDFSKGPRKSSLSKPDSST